MKAIVIGLLASAAALLVIGVFQANVFSVIPAIFLAVTAVAVSAIAVSRDE